MTLSPAHVIEMAKANAVASAVVVIVLALAIAYYMKWTPFSKKDDEMECVCTKKVKKGEFRAHYDNGAPNSTGVSNHVSNTGHDQGALNQGENGVNSESIEDMLIHDEGLASHARNMDISSAQVLACIGK